MVGSGAVALLAVGGHATPAAAVEQPSEPTMTGSAYAISVLSSGVLTPASIPGSPDTGAVESTGAGTYDAPCGIDLPPTAVVARGLCAGVTTGAQADTSVATASASTVKIMLQGLPQITLTGVRAQSISQCGASKGLADIGEVRVDNQVIPLGFGPNFSTDLAGQAGVSAKLIINEQIQSSEQLIVNAARLIVTGGGMGTTDMVIASAASGVRNCPAMVVTPVMTPPQQPAAAAQPPLTLTPPEISGLPPTKPGQ